MSIEACWDLQSPSIPRSVAVYSITSSTTTNSNNSNTNTRRNVSNNNPFYDQQQQLQQQTRGNFNNNGTVVDASSTLDGSGGIAVVYGTETGSLHYRTYLSSSFNSIMEQQNQNQLEQMTMNTNNNTNTSNNTPILPLGSISTITTSTSTNNNIRNTFPNSNSTSGNNNNNNNTTNTTLLPRQYFPIDLPTGTLAGPVVACIYLGGNSNTSTAGTSSKTNFRNQYTTSTIGSQQQVQNQSQQSSYTIQNNQQQLGQYPTGNFLLLIDDGRGTSISSPGAYNPVFVKSTMGTFQLINTSNATSYMRQPIQQNIVSSSGTGSTTTTTTTTTLPRISCATYYIPNNTNSIGGMLLYGSGRTIQQIPSDVWDPEDYTATNSNSQNSTTGGSKRTSGSSSSNNSNNNNRRNRQSQSQQQSQQQQVLSPPPVTLRRRAPILYFPTLPSPGIRSGQDSITITSHGNVIICAISNTIYAVLGTISYDEHMNYNINNTKNNTTNTSSSSSSSSTDVLNDRIVKLISFQQSSQVHPIITVDVHDESLVYEWSCIFVASGRECAIIDIYCDSTSTNTGSSNNTYPFDNSNSNAPAGNNNNNNNNSSNNRIHCSKPRNGIVTLTSPILAAVSSWPYIVVLTSDGLLTVRSPSCIAIPLRTIEVGQRPNDYYTLRTVYPISSFSSTTTSVVKGILSNKQQTTPAVLSGFYPQSSNNNNTTSNSNTAGTTTGSTPVLIAPWIIAVGYSGECKVLQCQPDTIQDLADRLMRHTIDAFGISGFPRNELAEAIHASFTATSYVGPEPTTVSCRLLLLQYLCAVLGLTDFESCATSGWPTTLTTTITNLPIDMSSRRNYDKSIESTYASVAMTSSGTLTCTAILCFVCSQINPQSYSSLASRAAKVCAGRMGVIFEGLDDNVTKATVQVCEIIAEKLLREASSTFTLSSPSAGVVSMTSTTSTSVSSSTARRPVRNGTSQQSNTMTDFIEAAMWLLRSCGKHERAIEIAYERLQQQQQQYQSNPTSINKVSSTLSRTTSGFEVAAASSTMGNSTPGGSSSLKGVWSQIRYESYTATHLSELWASGVTDGCRLVLSSPATYRLLENNPRLGLSVFIAMHPQNETQWRTMVARDDPLANPDRIYQVIQLLKSVNPSVPDDSNDITRTKSSDNSTTGAFGRLSLETGRALTVTFLVSAIGIDTGRPAEEEEFDSLPRDPEFEEHVANFHDELSFLLLEGVIAERRDDEAVTSLDDDGDRTELGKIYRMMLRQLLKWPLAKIRSDRFMKALPPSFRQEKALMLGRIGQHDDALRMLYCELQSLDLSLAYCDERHERQMARYEIARARYQQRMQSNSMYSSDMINNNSSDPMDNIMIPEEDNAYLPLVRIALESSDIERGTATAIQVLALRRGAIDRAAALRLLPSDVPVSAVARPFLIPALVDSESQVRRLTVVSALLRARYIKLKDTLVTAQLKAQANIHVVPAVKNLYIGNPLHSTKAYKLRSNVGTTSPGAMSLSSHMPEVYIIKHFFPRHLVIQARITNSNPGNPIDNAYAIHQHHGGGGGGGISTTGSSGGGGTSSSSAIAIVTGRVLSDIVFVVAESSDEAIQPLLQVPINVLPWKLTGCAWCVLQASPSLMEGTTAQLTCELRYVVQAVDAATTAVQVPSSSLSLSTTILPSMIATAGMGRTYVEELQDIEVNASHFS